MAPENVDKNSGSDYRQIVRGGEGSYGCTGMNMLACLTQARPGRVTDTEDSGLVETSWLRPSEPTR
jgi:hypothetical protein